MVSSFLPAEGITVWAGDKVGQEGDRDNMKGRAQLVSTYFGGSPDLGGKCREVLYFPVEKLSTEPKCSLSGQWQMPLPRPIPAWECFV